VADVQSGPAWIGKHVEDVELRFGRVEIFLAGIWRVKGAGLVPNGLPFWFEMIEWVRFAALVHAERIRNTGKQEENRNFLRSSFPNSFLDMRQLLLATRNRHKTQEFSQILGGDFEVRDLSENNGPAVEETGSTFAENASLKAVATSRRFPGLVVADDSGLEVDALNGAPGVFSARYAGANATDEANVARLLRELSGRSERSPFTARFRCVIAVARAGEVLHSFDGTVEGTIVDSPRGHGGFGYDPIFQPTGYDKTFGELPASVKNRISHRATAIRLLRAQLVG
jgi:XTP/dITP diphosphohydrolase